MKDRIEEIHLISMGYRQLENSQKWAKPVGFNLFVFDIRKQEWVHHFRNFSRPEELLVWKTSNYTGTEDDFQDVAWLSYQEAWHGTDGACAKGAHCVFAFLNTSEQVAHVLEL